MKINENYVLQEIADEFVVVPVGEAAKNLQGVIKLNDTGAYLWKKLRQESCTESELVDGMMAEYDVDRETAHTDVVAFVRQLSDTGCLAE